jgi:hypothetical protein
MSGAGVNGLEGPMAAGGNTLLSNWLMSKDLAVFPWEQA